MHIAPHDNANTPIVDVDHDLGVGDRGQLELRHAFLVVLGSAQHAAHGR